MSDTYTEVLENLESFTEETDDFGALLNESFGTDVLDKVIPGEIVRIEEDYVVIDTGLKSEGRIALHEFSSMGEAEEIAVGDIVDVYLERMENKDGEVAISREKAKREAAWLDLEKKFTEKEEVRGMIMGKVRGGYNVDLSGAPAFLPGSQIDVRPVRDVTPLMHMVQPFQILKMDRERGNIVVSRRMVLEQGRMELRREAIKKLEVNQIVKGVIKNVTDYGVFVDLGNIDGLLHVTDMSWSRLRHPSEVAKVGEEVEVMVIRFNEDTQRISLGLKQLQANPWQTAAEKYLKGEKFEGRVTNITDYGAFVELEPGIEGLVHLSEMRWVKRNVHPSKLLSTGETVQVMVLEFDQQRQRISLGMKQCTTNPWDELLENVSVGKVIEGQIKNISEFGLFVNLSDDIDGMAHISDLDWNESGAELLERYQIGDTVKARVLNIDPDRARISLGIKQLTEDPRAAAVSDIKKGSVVTCVVTAVQSDGIAVSVRDSLEGFIRRGELSASRDLQRANRFAVGEKFDAKITMIDKASNKLTLSIKALEVAEEREALEAYGSADSGATLGHILGSALKQHEEKEEVAAEMADQAGKVEAKPAKETVAKKSVAKTAKNATETENQATEEDVENTAAKEKAPAKKATPKKAASKKADVEADSTATDADA